MPWKPRSFRNRLPAVNWGLWALQQPVGLACGWQPPLCLEWVSTRKRPNAGIRAPPAASELRQAHTCTRVRARDLSWVVAPRCHFPLVTIASDFPFLVHIFSLSCISFPGPQGQRSPVASFPHPYPSHRLGSCTVIQETTTLGPSELQPGLRHSFSTCFPCTSPARERSC